MSSDLRSSPVSAPLVSQNDAQRAKDTVACRTFDLLELFEEVALPSPNNNALAAHPLPTLVSAPDTHARPFTLSQLVSLSTTVGSNRQAIEDAADVAVVNIVLTASAEPSTKPSARTNDVAHTAFSPDESAFLQELRMHVPGLASALEGCHKHTLLGKGQRFADTFFALDDGGLSRDGEGGLSQDSVAGYVRDTCNVESIHVVSCADGVGVPSHDELGHHHASLHLVYITQGTQREDGSIGEVGVDPRATSATRTLLRAALRLILREGTGQGLDVLMRKRTIVLRFWLDLGLLAHRALRHAWGSAVARYSERYTSAGPGNLSEVLSLEERNENRWQRESGEGEGEGRTESPWRRSVVAVPQTIVPASAIATGQSGATAVFETDLSEGSPPELPEDELAPEHAVREAASCSQQLWSPQMSSSLLDIATALLEGEEGMEDGEMREEQHILTDAGVSGKGKDEEAITHYGDIPFAQLFPISCPTPLVEANAPAPPPMSGYAGSEPEPTLLELYANQNTTTTHSDRGPPQKRVPRKARRADSGNSAGEGGTSRLPCRMAALFHEVADMEAAVTLGTCQDTRRLLVQWSGLTEAVSDKSTDLTRRTEVYMEEGDLVGEDRATLRLPPADRRLIILFSAEASVLQAALLSWTHRPFLENALILPILGVAPPPFTRIPAGPEAAPMVTSSPTSPSATAPLFSALKKPSSSRGRRALSDGAPTTRAKGRRSVTFDEVPVVLEAEPWELAAAQLTTILRDCATALDVDFDLCLGVHASQVGLTALSELRGIPEACVVPAADAPNALHSMLGKKIPALFLDQANHGPSLRATQKAMRTSMGSWCRLARELTARPRRPSVALRLVGLSFPIRKAATLTGGGTPGASRRRKKTAAAPPSEPVPVAMLMGCVLPSTLQESTLSCSSLSLEERNLATLAPPLALSPRCYTDQLRHALFAYAREVFGTQVLRTAVDVVRTAGPDYVSNFRCTVSGYLRFAVSAWVRRFVQVSFTVDMNALLLPHNVPNMTFTPSDGGSQAQVQRARQPLRHMRCTCTPRTHEQVQHCPATGAKLCRHMVELLYVMTMRQLGDRSVPLAETRAALSNRGGGAQDTVTAVRDAASHTTTDGPASHVLPPLAPAAAVAAYSGQRDGDALPTEQHHRKRDRERTHGEPPDGDTGSPPRKHRRRHTEKDMDTLTADDTRKHKHTHEEKRRHKHKHKHRREHRKSKDGPTRQRSRKRSPRAEDVEEPQPGSEAQQDPSDTLPGLVSFRSLLDAVTKHMRPVKETEALFRNEASSSRNSSSSSSNSEFAVDAVALPSNGQGEPHTPTQTSGTGDSVGLSWIEDLTLSSQRS